MRVGVELRTAAVRPLEMLRGSCSLWKASLTGDCKCSPR